MTIAFMEKILSDPDRNVRRKITGSLWRLEGEAGVLFLEKVIAARDMLVGGSSAYTAVGRIGGPMATDLLEKELASKDRHTPRLATRALGYVGSERARDLLLASLASSRDYSVRYTAFSALRDWFPDDPVAQEAVRKFKPRK